MGIFSQGLFFMPSPCSFPLPSLSGSQGGAMSNVCVVHDVMRNDRVMQGDMRNGLVLNGVLRNCLIVHGVMINEHIMHDVLVVSVSCMMS
jgi:hypothetical protein